MPEEVRLDIFERVNSGVPLTHQQMSNALYNGLATQWLKEQAITKFMDEDRKKCETTRLLIANLTGAFYYQAWLNKATGSLENLSRKQGKEE